MSKGPVRGRAGSPGWGLSPCCSTWAAPSLTQPPRAADQDKKAPEAPKGTGPNSYDQVSKVLLGEESFEAMMAKDKADKDAVMARQKKLLEERYDLTPRPDPKVKMTRGKPIPVGPTAKLPDGMTWEQAGAT